MRGTTMHLVAPYRVKKVRLGNRNDPAHSILMVRGRERVYWTPITAYWRAKVARGEAPLTDYNPN